MSAAPTPLLTRNVRSKCPTRGGQRMRPGILSTLSLENPELSKLGGKRRGAPRFLLRAKLERKQLITVSLS